MGSGPTEVQNSLVVLHNPTREYEYIHEERLYYFTIIIIMVGDYDKIQIWEMQQQKSLKRRRTLLQSVN